MVVDKRNMVVGTNIDDLNAEIYLVGLSRVRPLQRASEIESDEEIEADGSPELESDDEADHKFKRQKIRGPSIHLGPVPNAESPPKQVFQEITTWIEKLGRVSLPKTARCIGRVDDLPDWIEIAAISMEDIDKFKEIWDRRPGALRGVVCVKAL